MAMSSLFWVVPALLSPIFAALVNHIDKALLSRYFKGGGAGALVIFSACIGFPIALLIAIFSSQIWVIAPSAVAILIVNGMIYMAGIVPYLYALMEDEASIVSPLSQMISPISLVLGLLFLNEAIAAEQMVGGVIVMLGAVLLSIKVGEVGKRKRHISIKKKVVGLMFVASFFVALNGLLFKSVAIHASFWTTAFWEYVGVMVFGLLAFCFVPTYRHQFIDVLRQNKLSILSINAINEVCAVIAKLTLHFATLLAPLAAVFWIAEGFQPVFVLVFGILLTMFFPHISKEEIKRHVLYQKIAAILAMMLGTYLLAK